MDQHKRERLLGELAHVSDAIDRGERQVAEALALPWEQYDERRERELRIASALGVQAEIHAAARTSHEAIRKEIAERTPA